MSERFCPDCDNLMIPNFDDEKGGLVRECIICGHRTDLLTNVKDQFLSNDNMGTVSMHMDMNLNRGYDRTHLHTSKVECPNAVCPTITDGTPRDVLVFAYNENLLQGYFCTHCKYLWSN